MTTDARIVNDDKLMNTRDNFRNLLNIIRGLVRLACGARGGSVSAGAARAHPKPDATDLKLLCPKGPLSAIGLLFHPERAIPSKTSFNCYTIQ